ncbi:MAG: aminotransferase class V-fold PLP-dependent enzyme [Gemmatimonas sp.]|nr:aminotransferase class V-fold PLP-dependent enzyme [Gemmatimonas sp.]
MEPIYFDYAATTPVRPEVREAMLPLLEGTFGNPSSLHRWGREAKMKLEDARARIAAIVGARPTEIVFTRGGTEADNLAILGRTRKERGRTVVCSSIEHRAVLNAARAAEEEGNPLHLLPVDSQGRVALEGLAEVLSAQPAVVSVMWANNEVGTIQPIPELAQQCAAANVPFHSDAVQAIGKLDVRVDHVPVTLLSMSAHKIGGPKGVGALFVRKGTALRPLIHGGGHERGLRAGTEDVAGAVGFATAAELAVKERAHQCERITRLRDRLQHALEARVPDLVVNAAGAERLPTILNVSIPGANSEMLLVMLDLEGIAASSGSACSSGGVNPSHVLTTMGIPADVAGPSVRFSLGRETTEKQIDEAIAILPPLMERLRSTSGV